MSFRLKIKFVLVHKLGLSNKRVQNLLEKGKVELNGNTITTNEKVDGSEEITVNGKLVVPKKEFIYLKFYKPKGFASTLNNQEKNNLSSFFEGYSNLAIAGRLDKQSEGLLLMSNDGKWIETICNPTFEKEKEYLVELDKEPDAAFLKKFTDGVKIGKHFTKKCQCWLVSHTLIRVILTEGKNRQIRRMCKTLGYEVLSLVRIRISDIELKDLKPAGVEKITRPCL